MDSSVIEYLISNSYKSTRQLERETKINRNKISKILKENGIDKNNRLSDSDKEFILHNKHMEYKEIASHLNRPVSTIKGFLNKNKIYKYKKYTI